MTAAQPWELLVTLLQNDLGLATATEMSLDARAQTVVASATIGIAFVGFALTESSTKLLFLATLFIAILFLFFGAIQCIRIVAPKERRIIEARSYAILLHQKEMYFSYSPHLTQLLVEEITREHRLLLAAMQKQNESRAKQLKKSQWSTVFGISLATIAQFLA